MTKQLKLPSYRALQKNGDISAIQSRNDALKSAMESLYDKKGDNGYGKGGFYVSCHIGQLLKRRGG